jgi:toxin YoeB
MVDNVSFTLEGLKEYMDWQKEDRKTLDKINKLINDIIRNGNEGIGHPEPLKNNLSGKWSRKIDEKNRVVYKIHNDGKVEIFNCKGHYSDK